MKKCPYCAEEIRDEATVCRFCGRDLVVPAVDPKVERKPGCGRSVAALILTIGALIIISALSRSCTNETANSTSSQPTFDQNKNSYTMISNLKDFVTYPTNYKGDKIAVKCEVFNVISTSQFQCWTIEGQDAIAVITNDDFNGLYEDDLITVYGVGGGKACGENAMGGEVCQPLITKAWYTKP